MVELELPKRAVRVRFPSPAPPHSRSTACRLLPGPRPADRRGGSAEPRLTRFLAAKTTSRTPFSRTAVRSERVKVSLSTRGRCSTRLGSLLLVLGMAEDPRSNWAGPASIALMTNDQPTQFPELNGLLQDLVENVTGILEANLVGIYLVGSFALGDADIHSDCDFVVVVRNPLTSRQETRLRALHREVFRQPRQWAQHLEGSYAPRSDLRTLRGLARNGSFLIMRTRRWSGQLTVTPWNIGGHCERPASPSPGRTQEISSTKWTRKPYARRCAISSRSSCLIWRHGSGSTKLHGLNVMLLQPFAGCSIASRPVR